MFARGWLLVMFGMLLSLASAGISLQAEEPPVTSDLAKFPKLSGKLIQLLGHEGGFMRPKAGEPFQLELAKLADIEKLNFDPKRRSYIPLNGPLAVETLRYAQNGTFVSMRLVSQQRTGYRIIVDIVPKPGRGPNFVEVWVIVEREVTSATALIECEAAGAFPEREK